VRAVFGIRGGQRTARPTQILKLGQCRLGDGAWLPPDKGAGVHEK